MCQKKVARFFRAFKYWEQCHKINIQTDASAARLFRRHYENSFGAIVPFQSFRNQIKDDPETFKFVRDFYAKKPNHPVYLLFFDDDFATLRPFGVGLLSVYDKFIRHKLETTNKLPTFLSTGYRFATQPVISIVASEIDRWLRAATAHIIPSGVCYPEPNMAILAKNPALTVTGKILNAQFDEEKLMQSKTESRDFVQSALTVGDITTDTIFFLPYAPLPTETPKRVINKSKIVKAELTANGRITHWNKTALLFLRNMPQSHVGSHAWAQAVVAAMTLNRQINPEIFGVQAIKILDKNIDNLAMSAVCKMFSAYSPVSVNVLKSITGRTPNAYAQAYGHYLLDYENQVPSLSSPDKIRKDTDLYYQCLRAIQEASSMEELRLILANFFVGGQSDAQKIEDAAKLAGKIVRDGILYYYDFGNNPAIEAARQTTIMHQLEQQSPNLIALESTPIQSVQRSIELIISPSKPIPQMQITNPIGFTQNIIQVLRLLKKSKKQFKITNTKLVEVFSLDKTGLASSTLSGYISKIHNGKLIPKGALGKISTLIFKKSQQLLLKDLANDCDLNANDMLTIIGASPGKIQALMAYGLDSVSVLQSSLTVFQFFQILGFFG